VKLRAGKKTIDGPTVGVLWKAVVDDNLRFGWTICRAGQLANFSEKGVCRSWGAVVKRPEPCD